MSNFKQNGINFTISNNFKTGEKKHVINGKLTSAQNDYSGYTNNDNSFLLNAVDIDWNSAELPHGNPENGNSVTLNTTGQLLSLINKMAEVIKELETQINELQRNL